MSLAQSKLKFDVHGFVKTDYWWDTRQVAYAREGLFTLFPKDQILNSKGIDINDQGSFNFSAITSRANVKISGTEAFGAKVIGFMEADFSGMSNQDINGFRLRHAFIKLNWGKSNLILGQYWHPLFVTEVFPSVISLNTGAPFQPFNRAPQARFTYSLKKLDIIAAAMAQRDYASIGPDERSFSYLSNSMIPNAHLQLRYKGKKHTYGLATDFKTLKPTLATDSGFVSNEVVNSLSYMAFYQFKSKAFQAKTKAVLGQNLADQLMLGGYAVSSYDIATGLSKYTPTNHMFVFANMLYTVPLKKEGNKLRIGVFGGYAKNLGTSEKNTGTYYASGSNIDQLYRASSSLSIISGKVQFSMEYEYTQALYGIADADGLIQNTHPIANNRLLFTGFYFF